MTIAAAICVALSIGKASADEVRGVYLETRTCQVYTGPCFANAETALAGKNAIMAWKIEKGSSQGVDLAKLALQFSIANENFTTCVTGSANPQRVEQWVRWSEEPLDQDLLLDVQKILEPIHNWFYTEGRPENNDEL